MSPLDLAEPGCSFFSSVPDRPFLPEDFSSDEQLMIAEAESFSRKEVLPLQDRLDAQEEGLMVGLVRKAGSLGFCGIDAPEAYGGLGLGKNIAARLLEYLSLNASFSVTYGITSGISQFGLALFGTEDQKKAYLPLLTSGEWIGAYALSEPNSGSDALSMSAKAEKTPGGWVLNGTKMWISNAKWADLFLVMAKSEGDKVCAFLVPRDAPGVSISREEHKLGLKGSSTARLVLENALVPLDALVHEEGKGHHVAFNALNMGRFKLGAMSLGPARLALESAVRYAQDRRQFGRPLTDFGLIRQKLAEMAAWYFAAESALYRTGALIDQAFDSAGGSLEAKRAAAEEYAIECSLVKVLCTEAEGRIVDEALQIYGGYGFTEEFPIARIYRDCRVSRIYEGTNEINRVFTASRFPRRVTDFSRTADHWTARLAGQAFVSMGTDQIRQGAAADLLMLHFAIQSARARGDRLGGAAALAADVFESWSGGAGFGAALKAGVSPEGITASAANWDALAEAVIAKGGPL